MVELHLQGHFDLPTLVDRMCHAPARLYHIENRGYIRCGQFADLVLFSINPTDKQEVTTAKLAGKCGWSPYEGCHFATQIEYTWVNGQAVVANRQIQAIEKPGIPLTYER